MSESAAKLFEPLVPKAPLVPPTPLHPATAADVKDALRKRHPGGDVGQMVGQWTCIEEWLGIDLLALNAWQKADVIGYEVKISRSDLRRELLRPHKRADAVERTTEFYFAVPAGLLTDEEIAYEEPEWEAADFEREQCPGVPEFGPEPRTPGFSRRFGGRCYRTRENERRVHKVRVPLADVVAVPEWLKHREDESDEAFMARVLQHHRIYGDNDAPCWNCGGKGYLEKSRVEREAPTCWVPRDVGLITISARGCRVAKPSPKRKDPKPIAANRQRINDLVRWVSHRPDPRHRSAA